MEAYRYKAINAQGRVSQGRVDAVNPADLETRLARMGLDLVNYRELPSRNRNVTGRGIERIDLITFCFHLEQLVRAGARQYSRACRICATRSTTGVCEKSRRR